MRLLNASTFTFETTDPQTYAYAVLSHRWVEQEEITYQEMLACQTDTNHPSRNKAGFKKILNLCKQACKDDYSHVWIDTCCIEKSSSAELSESINSMWDWYKQADQCYAYLEGVSLGLDGRINAAFEKNAWFTRGWTLQELIAPKNVQFFTDNGQLDEGWMLLGDKDTLCERLSTITGIDEDVLSGARDLTSFTIAQRMSWAADRITTRLEDRAYSLMGLFGVNMPMIYGEGEKSFIRLQEEIMKDSDDESIFAWTDPKASPDHSYGLLATSPAMFKQTRGLFTYTDWEPRSPFLKTNRGLQISLPLRPLGGDLYAAALNCPQLHNREGFTGIYLKRLTHLDDTKSENQYSRVRVGGLVGIREAKDRGNLTTIYVRQNFAKSVALDSFAEHLIQLRQGPQTDSGYRLVNTIEGSLKFEVSKKNLLRSVVTPTFRISKLPSQLAVPFIFERRDETQLCILLGTSVKSSRVALCALPDYNSETFVELESMYTPGSLRLENEYEVITINVDTKGRHETQYFLVDLTIVEKPSAYQQLIDIIPGGNVMQQLSRNLVPEISHGIKESPGPNKESRSRVHRIFRRKDER